MNSYEIKSPYPYFGKKSRVADIIWKGLGELDNYIEPFAGSLSVLLASPQISKMETVNDKDHFISNFWRAISDNPEKVAKFADYPVTEADLHARHKWLVDQITPDFVNKINNDPNFCDHKIAGWWVWGMGASIGNNWLKPKGLNALPVLSCPGTGIHAQSASIHQWFKALQERTKRVRITCGDWKRILTPSVTYQNKGVRKDKMTGIFLDPPYDLADRDKVYRQESNIYQDVCEWAVANGDHPKMRIVVCGYDGSFKFPESWTEFSWQANGGMAALGEGRGKDNAKRERIYFSKYCCQI